LAVALSATAQKFTVYAISNLPGGGDNPMAGGISDCGCFTGMAYVGTNGYALLYQEGKRP
jgi:hypothetical protein